MQSGPGGLLLEAYQVSFHSTENNIDFSMFKLPEVQLKELKNSWQAILIKIFSITLPGISFGAIASTGMFYVLFAASLC